MNLQEFKDIVNDLSEESLAKVKELVLKQENIVVLGNGGSSAIAAHIAEDYTKTLGIRTISFNDSARLSCYANDYGWEHAYAKYIEHMALPGSLVILISSSGNSENILNAAKYCEGKFDMLTLSGFDKNNKLLTQWGDKSLHIWVDSQDYGIVESLHHFILHSVI